MAWIESMLVVEENLSVDDFFTFYRSGRVVSLCGTPESEEPAHPDFVIEGVDCDHELSEFGEPVIFDEWLNAQCKEFDRRSENWPCDLKEEVFFRGLDNILGGHELTERGVHVHQRSYILTV